MERGGQEAFGFPGTIFRRRVATSISLGCTAPTSGYIAKAGRPVGRPFQDQATAPGSHDRTKDPTVPNGSDYVLIFGGESTTAFTRGADAFRNNAPSRLDRDLSDLDRKMLALRQGERQCVLTEEIRVHGPARAAPGDTMPPGPCIQLGSFNCPRESEDQLLAWYSDFRLPAVQEARSSSARASSWPPPDG